VVCQGDVLRIVGDNPGITRKEIAEKLNDPYAYAGMANPLKSLKLKREIYAIKRGKLYHWYKVV
jgi:hypothetical protein